MLGNFFLRISSAAIRDRRGEDFTTTLKEILCDPNHFPVTEKVTTGLTNLVDIVDAELGSLQPANAVDSIMNQLKEVTISIPSRTVSLTAYFVDKRSFELYPTVEKGNTEGIGGKGPGVVFGNTQNLRYPFTAFHPIKGGGTSRSPRRST